MCDTDRSDGWCGSRAFFGPSPGVRLPDTFGRCLLAGAREPLGTVGSMLLAAGAVQTLGGRKPRLVFGEEPKAAGEWAGRRVLSLDEKPAFELSFWCGTCQFLFKRLEGANQTLSLGGLQQRLTD